VLTLERVQKKIGERMILRDVTLHVEAGECLALFGPSGCGKTTLLRLVAGLDEFESGTITIDGRLASAARVIVPPHERGVGMVFQSLALWPPLTALAHVEFSVPKDRKRKRERLAVARGILSSVQLDGRENRYPHELSGGEQQRLALARALASRPKILLLDEPCSSLDRARRHDMLQLIRGVLAKDHVTTVYVTHQSDEVSSVATRVAMMAEGHVGEILPIGEFMNLTESDEG